MMVVLHDQGHCTTLPSPLPADVGTLSVLCRLTQLDVCESCCSADDAVRLAVSLPALAHLGLGLWSRDDAGSTDNWAVLLSLSNMTSLRALALNCHFLGWEADAIALPSTVTVGACSAA